jgi:hypothetical protein
VQRSPGEFELYHLLPRLLMTHRQAEGLIEVWGWNWAWPDLKILKATSSPMRRRWPPPMSSVWREITDADGNKRTAWVVARAFLVDNGYRLSFDPADAVKTVEALSAARLSEDELAQWSRRQIEMR